MAEPLTGSILGALSTALNLVKAIKDLKEATAVRGQLIELYELIVSGQTSALEEVMKHRALLEQIHTLEEKIRADEEWQATKERYALTQPIPGNYLYALKESASASEPPHLICEKCYQNRKRSLLHYHFEHGIGQVLKCNACKSTHYLSAGPFEIEYAPN